MQGPWDYGSLLCPDWEDEYISIQMVASSGVTESRERFGTEKGDSSWNRTP